MACTTAMTSVYALLCRACTRTSSYREICLRCANKTYGYLNQPPCDELVWDEEDNLPIVARSQDMILRRRTNIFRKEIEERVILHPLVVGVAAGTEGAAASPLAVELIKWTLNRDLDIGGLAHGIDGRTHLYVTMDAHEVIDVFTDKLSPRFTGA
jgi:hypothetical protein